MFFVTFFFSFLLAVETMSQELILAKVLEIHIQDIIISTFY